MNWAYLFASLAGIVAVFAWLAFFLWLSETPNKRRDK